MGSSTKWIADPDATDIAALSATTLVERYRRRELSPVDVLRKLQERIRDASDLNAFASLDPVSALEGASASEARWARGQPSSALDGVPVSVKDLLDVRGFPTRKGSRTTSDEEASGDSPPAARLREAGAVLLGKTTTAEFGLGGPGTTPSGALTRNPWDPARSPGGSSSGAVVAAAAGLGPIAVGTDGGGSIRVPSAWTGVVGFKPTFGRIPTTPSTVAGAPPVVGPIAREVADVVLAFSVLAAPDPRDPFRLPPAPVDLPLQAGIPSDLLVGAVPLSSYAVDPDIAEAFARSLEIFRELGARVEILEAPLPSGDEALRTFFRARAAHTIRNLSASSRELLHPTVLESALAGERLSALDFLVAEGERTHLSLILAGIHGRYDLLLTPATAATAPAIDGSDDPHWPKDVPRAPFTGLFSLTRQPAVSVPSGIGSSGLPLGLQIVGRPFEDTLVLRAALAFERLRPPLHVR